MLRWKSSLKPAAAAPGGGTNPGTSNLVAWLGMEEGSGTSVADSTSNNNDFTLTNGSWVTGKVGSYAVRLDGNDDYMESDANFAVGANVCTVSFWMYWTDAGSDEKFIYELGNRWWQRNGSIAFSWVQNESVFKVSMHDGSGNLEVKFPEPSSGQWVYVTVVHNGPGGSSNAGEIKLYYDGTAQSSSSYSSTKDQANNIGSTASKFFIGANSTGAQEITIDVDTFAVFSDELTQDEITWMYNSGNGRSYSDVSGAAANITLENQVSTTGVAYSGPINIDVNIPAVSANDILLLLCTTNDTSAPTDSPPGGWTKIAEQDGSSAGISTVAAYWKRASGSASATTEEWSAFYPDSEIYYIWVGAYSGCTTSSSPIDAYGTNAQGYSASWSVSVTTTVANTMVVSLMGTRSSGRTVTWADGTELIDTVYQSTASVHINEKLETSAGSKTRSATPSAADSPTSIAVALKP